MQVRAIKHIGKWGQVHGYTKIDNDHILSVDGASLCVIPDEFFILNDDDVDVLIGAIASCVFLQA